MKTLCLLISILFMLVINCQYPVDQTILPEGKRYLVVDADLSESYFKFNLQYSLTDLGLKGAYGVPRKPGSVIAYLQDSKGVRLNIKRFDGVSDTTIRGKVGESYTLNMTVDNKQYISELETMRPCPEISTIKSVYNVESGRDKDDIYYHGFDVLLETKDIPGVENFYQWDWIHYVKAISCGKREVGGMEVAYNCAPRDCWDIVYNTSIISQSDALRDGNIISKRIVRVPFINPPQKYYLRIEQRSITPRVFEFVKSLENQTQTIGTLFDLPPQTKFSPNIKNVTDPSEKIIGTFNVFANRSQVVYIDLAQSIPNVKPKVVSDPTPFHPDPLVTLPCVEGQYRTKIKPIGWVD